MFYDFFRWIAVITAYPAQWIFFKRKTYFEDPNIQRTRIKGGALIISNHFNALDYILNMFTVLPRKLYVVASEYAFANPLIRFGMKFWGGIQANRITKNMRFVDQSADLIRRGKLVQIFPEGRNTPDGKIHPFKPSHIAIALRARKPIIPIISDGNYGLFKQTHVIIGTPIDLYELLGKNEYSRHDIYALNDAVYQKVLNLRDELDRKIQNSERT